MIKISEQVEEFVREAIKLEIRGREFFNQVADMTHNYDLLQAQYDSVTGTGFWLDSAEFQMDGKY